jgi:hypothetical protein
MPRLLRAAVLAGTASLALTPAAARAADRVVSLSGSDAPGTPAKYDKVKVVVSGSKQAKRILVLEPGTLGGAGYFRPVMHDIVKRLPG